MKAKEEYILWLPSWYPNKFEPFNGDFIQRHAQATSLYCKIVVGHFPQLSESVRIDEPSTEIHSDNNLKELIHYCKFIPTGIKPFDRLRYNYLYYKQTLKFLKEYFNDHGLPKLVHVHIPVKAGNIALWIKKKYKIGYIVSEQTSLYLEGAPDSFSKRSFIYQNQVRNVFKRALLATNVSKTIGELLLTKFDLPEIATVHNTVDTDLFYISKEKKETFTFIHVSSFSNQKNIIGIFKAFSEYKKCRTDWKLQMIGPYTEQVVKYIDDFELADHVELLGTKSYMQVAAYMKSANVFVLFSLYENFPCVIVEALCCGLPVVSADVAGIKEAINDENGILVEMRNEIELLEAIKKIHNEYNSYDLEMIASKASSVYNYREIGRQFFNLYK